MAALIIAIFPQNSSRGNREEQQDRTDPNSRFELARKPAWLLAFRQFGLPKWKHDFETDDYVWQYSEFKYEDAAATEPSSPTVAGFSDVYESDYYAEAVAWAKEGGVTSGTGDGATFSPAATVTRAEAVTFLWRAAGSPEPAEAVSPFSDVADPGAYYYDAVLWAAETGITGGVGGGRFGLTSTLSYDQILAFLCRAAGESAAGSDWSAAAVSWAAENGLTDGLTFTAGDSCPRADVVYCLWKQLA